jgi:hypothetical protein
MPSEAIPSLIFCREQQRRGIGRLDGFTRLPNATTGRGGSTSNHKDIDIEDIIDTIEFVFLETIEMTNKSVN